MAYELGCKERKFSMKSSGFLMFSMELLYKLMDLVRGVIKSKWVVKGRGLEGEWVNCSEACD
jgi:hypothetical protein